MPPTSVHVRSLESHHTLDTSDTVRIAHSSRSRPCLRSMRLSTPVSASASAGPSTTSRSRRRSLRYYNTRPLWHKWLCHVSLGLRVSRKEPRSRLGSTGHVKPSAVRAEAFTWWSKSGLIWNPLVREVGAFSRLAQVVVAAAGAPA